MPKIYPIMFFISIALTISAIVVLVLYGLNFGVDFKGGSIVEITFASDRPELNEVRDAAGGILSGKDISANLAGANGILIRTSELTEAEHQRLLAGLRVVFPASGMTEQKFDSVGPVIGQELRSKSIKGIVILLIAITVYIAIVFRKMSRTLSPWVMGIAVLLALAHDVLIPIGVFALLGAFLHVEVNAIFIAAILTILGYSVSDSVVVFDRVRENIIKGGDQGDFGGVVHRSIMQTLARSLNTTITTLLSLIAIYFFGGESIRYFALALIIGIFLGAYSSIFVASPLLVWWKGQRKRA